MNITVQQFMKNWNDEMQEKHKNYINPNNLNYYIDGLIAVSPADKYLSLDYYYTDFNDLPEPYHSKVVEFCQKKGYHTLLLDFSLDELFKQSINMNIQQVKALIDKNNAIRQKKEEIEHDFSRTE